MKPNWTHINTTNGFRALIDKNTMSLIDKFKWYVNFQGGKPYVVTTDSKHLKLSRVIMKAEYGQAVDHINGDTLDNRKINLRVCSLKQNSRNRNKQRALASSKYKGVSWHKIKRRWQARIICNRICIYLGYFISELDAAMAYDRAATRYFGEFAKLNF